MIESAADMLSVVNCKAKLVFDFQKANIVEM